MPTVVVLFHSIERHMAVVEGIFNKLFTTEPPMLVVFAFPNFHHCQLVYQFGDLCCGAVPYNSEVNACCSQQLSPLPTGLQVWGSDHSQCCGSVPYNSEVHACCDDQIAEKGAEKCAVFVEN